MIPLTQNIIFIEILTDDFQNGKHLCASTRRRKNTTVYPLRVARRAQKPRNSNQNGKHSGASLRVAGEPCAPTPPPRILRGNPWSSCDWNEWQSPRTPSKNLRLAKPVSGARPDPATRGAQRRCPSPPTRDRYRVYRRLPPAIPQPRFAMRLLKAVGRPGWN
jgi:hypothetical protein